ncbi:MAG: response regulator transcription factor [bacterium]|nr:response regulator transcription factor [bacterium]
MKLRTVLVEDEIHSLERLKSMLKDFSSIDIVGESSDGETAVKLIDELKPDLLFLDIQLPVYNGFEVLEMLTYKPDVIFITSYNQYAIKAFEENAVDYLLKPTSKERLQKSIDRISTDRNVDDLKLVKLLKSRIFPEYICRFSVKFGDDIFIIPEDRVLYFKADNKNLFLGTQDREFLYDSTLKELENNLDPEKFLRANKGCIVAVEKVSGFSKWFLGEYHLKLKDKNKTSVKVGRKYLPVFRNKFRF